MKKGILKTIGLTFCAAVLLTGCATVSDVKINGKEAYFKEVQYNQGQVVKVGDYLYFGNGYTASDDASFSYKKAAKSGYLARLNISKDLSYSKDVSIANQSQTSPKGVQQVNDEKLIGYQYQQMYALGEYIYFTSANTHKTSDMESDYSQVSLFRVKFNGDKCKELVKNSAFKTGEGSQITLQKGSNGKHYFLIAEPTDESTFTIKSLQVGDKIGELKTIVKNAKSYVLADDTSSIKNIVYTVDSGRTQTTTAVKSIDFATGEETTLDNGVAGSDTKLLARTGDNIFYSYTEGSATAVYQISATSNNGYSPNSNKRFYARTTISDVYKAGEGFVFKGESGALLYHTLISTADPETLATAEDFTDVLFVDEDYVYLSSATAIKRVSTIDKTIETIVSFEEDTIISGQCGYADGYIYYYAKLGELELEEGEEQRDDSNYYMYRTDLAGNSELIGKTV